LRAADFYWKHDSEWSNAKNWVDGIAPKSNEIAAFGVTDYDGRSADACAQPDAAVNIPTRQVQQSGGFVLQDGVEIFIGIDAEIKLNEREFDDVVEWKCKSATDVDFRCSANWASSEDRTDIKGGIPCDQDTVWFTDSFNVDNSGVPMVEAVIVMENGREREFDKAREIMNVHNEYGGFKRSFIPTTAFDSDRITMAAAALECFDSCPEKDTTTTAAEKYNVAHDHLVKRQEFISDVRAALGDEWTGSESKLMMKPTQEEYFGRELVYVFTGADGKTPAKVQVTADPADSAAFVSEMETLSKDHFKPLTGPGGCLNNDGKAFEFQTTHCMPISGFGAADACTNGVSNKQKNLYKDECPSTSRAICLSNKQQIVATRIPLDSYEFAETTCGEFNEIPALLSRTSAEEKTTIAEVCCEAKKDVKIVACGFVTQDMQSTTAVDLYAKAAKQVTKGLFHGADRGEGRPSEGVCTVAYVATDMSDKFLPVDISAADGAFLQVNDMADLDTSIGVNALANSEFATALSNWEVSDKADDFDEKFHVKKFRGEVPDRKRRGFNKVRGKIEQMMAANLPFGDGITFETIEDGADYPEFGSQIVVESLRVNFFATNGIAIVDHSKIEKYLANIFLGYGLEAAEYMLKKEEFAWLTTSTTTLTTVTTTKTTTTVTEEFAPQASGVDDPDDFVKTIKNGFEGKDAGLFICKDGSDYAADCPVASRVLTLTVQLRNMKDEYDSVVAGEKQKHKDLGDKLENLKTDLETKRASYLNTKEALNECDRTGLDKLGSIAYPDGCVSQKRAFEKAASDFLAFVLDGGEEGDRDYNAKVTDIESAQIAANKKIVKTMTDYQEDLADLAAYTEGMHGTKGSTNYKSPEEVIDLQANFDQFTMVMDLLVEELEDFMEGVDTSYDNNGANAASMKMDLEKLVATLTKNLKDCQDHEADRLADVPSPVLSEGSKIYKEELALKAATIAKTCEAHSTDLGIAEGLLGDNARRWAAAEGADKAVKDEQEEIEESIEGYKATSEETRSAVNARVIADAAWPSWLVPVIGAAGGLVVLLVIVAVVMSKSGGGGGGGGHKGGMSQNWGDQSQSVVAFENPVYDEQGGAGQFNAPEMEEEESGGLYDEPETLSAPAENNAGGGYLDVEPEEEEEEEESAEEEESEEESSEEESSDGDSDE
jgi:hypothetical protein